MHNKLNFGTSEKILPGKESNGSMSTVDHKEQGRHTSSRKLVCLAYERNVGRYIQ